MICCFAAILCVALSRFLKDQRGWFL